MPDRKIPWRRRVVFTALTLVAALTVTAAGIEGMAHLIDPRHGFAAWYERSMSYLVDEEVDWVAEPRQYEWTRVNRYHFRGPHVSRTKPDNVLRIAALGGSSTFDIYTPDDDTWPALLEKGLRADVGLRVEVLNAATPGYSTWQSSRLLRARVLDWDPDLVLVYHLANDSLYFRHADRQAIAQGWKLNAAANYIGAIAHEPYPPLALASKVLPRSVDLLRMQVVKRLARSTLETSHAFWVDRTLSGRVQDAGLGLYEESLEAMARVLRDRGTPLAIVTQVTLLRPDNSQEERSKISYHYRGLTHQRLLDAYERAWALNRAVAERHQEVFLIPAHEYMPGTFDYLSDGVHLNAAGRRKLAEFVGSQLIEQGLVE